MHIERLTKLAELLESHNGHRVIEVDGRRIVFDLQMWNGPASELRDQVVEENCGTACCAVGLAAQTPWFIEQGLRLGGAGPSYGGEFGFDATADFFGLTYWDSKKLFSKKQYLGNPKPSDVAARIRALIAQPRREEIEG